MNFEKIIYDYKLNRPLSEEEKELQLKQKSESTLKPMGQTHVIQINSIFLETVDKIYGYKGFLSSGMLAVAILFLWAGIQLGLGSLWDAFSKNINNPTGAFFAGLFVIVTSAGLVTICLWLLIQESFKWTHYPIRLNRKNRMVYVFRMDGSILSVLWDEVFFTLARAQKGMGVQFWKIVGHILDKDGITVRNSFSFGYASDGQDDVRQFWEYLRRYMETDEGPAEAIQNVDFCLPINDRRESFGFGLLMFWLDLHGRLIAQLFMLPFNLFGMIGRTIGMRFGKIPQWPKEVEEACAIEPNDPYVRTWRMNKGPAAWGLGLPRDNV